MHTIECAVRMSDDGRTEVQADRSCPSAASRVCVPHRTLCPEKAAGLNAPQSRSCENKLPNPHSQHTLAGTFRHVEGVQMAHGGGQGCIRREGASEAAPEAVRQAVGGGGQSGWGRLLAVTNAIEADPAYAVTPSPGTCNTGQHIGQGLVQPKKTVQTAQSFLHTFRQNGLPLRRAHAWTA